MGSNLDFTVVMVLVSGLLIALALLAAVSGAS